MNKNAIKGFATWARTELISAVTQKAFEYDVTKDGKNITGLDSIHGRVLSNDEKWKRDKLISQIKAKGFDQVMEEAAYIWFNRFIALRFMEVNGYLPSKVRVFTNENNEFKPEMLTNASTVELAGIDVNTVFSFIESQDNEGLYKYLLILQWNELSNCFPNAFQELTNYIELLCPNNLLQSDSIIGMMISSISVEDWTDQVQIIGWLFEGYVQTNREIFRKEQIVNKKNMATVNQVFTPDWIVKYMVENTIGRKWLETHPNSGLKQKLLYYIDEVENSDKADDKFKPEDIKFIEPCCGSGHVLAYAFDILTLIYEEIGYSSRDIPESILKNNIFAFDIDARAAQLASFSLMMKARKNDRRIFTKDIKPNVFVIPESNEISEDYGIIMQKYGFSKSAIQMTNYLVDKFKYGKVLGTTLIFEDKDYDSYIDELLLKRDQINTLLDNSFFEDDTVLLVDMAKIASALSNQYDVLITNPPYSALAKLEDEPKKYLMQKYKNSNTKCNLCSIYLESPLVKYDGFISMLTSAQWTKQDSFEKIRKNIINANSILSMLFIGEEEVNAMVDTVAFVIRRSDENNFGKYYSLSKLYDRSNFINIAKPNIINKSSFFRMEGSIINETFKETDITVTKMHISDFAVGRDGLHTCDNERFLRLWHEVCIDKFYPNCSSINESIISSKKWFPYCKGGEYRQYYGNNNYVVNWQNDGAEMKSIKDLSSGKVKSHGYNGDYSFLEGFTWTYRTHSNFAVRYTPIGYLFDGKGSKAFCMDNNLLMPIIGYLNSKVARRYLGLYSTTAFEVSTVLRTPFLNDNTLLIGKLTKECVKASIVDWDSYETSWDFKKHPLV